MEETTKNTLIDSLNPAQREAVLHDQGPLLVIAGAGSGKTKTLVHRVAYLVEKGVAPESILLLTFTRKSAQEMLHRASHILDNRCHNVSGGTFHGFANEVLHRYAPHLGYDRHFTIMDRSDAEDLIQLVRKELVPTTQKRFPKKSTIASVFSKAVNTQHPIEKIVSQDYPQFVEFSGVIGQLYHRYAEQKRMMHVMDYDDLLIKLLELLQYHGDVVDALQSKFQYIMVDEYQDTNAIQSDIIRYLTPPSRNVMVVGDDSQSIYSFRGADFKNIMNFPTLFPGAKIVKLEENYRSSQPILDLTNAVIERAREKYSKELFTKRQSFKKPIFVETDSENAQSQWVCDKILELRELGVELNQIAVLVRSGWHSNDLEVELNARNIPFSKFGGFKFVESAHVKDLMSYVRVVHNPSDAVSWHRLLLLYDGVGPKAAQKIVDTIILNRETPNRIDLSAYRNKPVFNDLTAILKWSLVQPPDGHSPKDVMDFMHTVYKPIFESRYDDYNKRKSDLESLLGIAERYTNLDKFLSEMSLEPPDASVEATPETQDNERITISTIHSSKGLEWHSVFLISAIDGYLPSFQSLGDLSQLEEERRLMYVALTRAKENLFIIKPHIEPKGGQFFRYPGMSFSKASRFLKDGDLLRRYTDQKVITSAKKYYL